MRLAEIQRIDSAVGLIQRGLRLSIVSHTTGIPLKTLRSLHREIHGRSPPSGQMPSMRGMLATRQAQAITSLFAALYHSVGGAGIYAGIDLTALLAAHDLYLSLLEEIIPCEPSAKPLDITQAWVIARDIRTGAAYFQACRTCLIRYLYALDCRLSLRCPICALRRREVLNTRL